MALKTGVMMQEIQLKLHLQINYITAIDYILKYVTKTVTSNCNNISNLTVYCIFYQINMCVCIYFKE